ncbi:MAG: hypothetical protein U0414_08750 [Polyangiaceae bacterium]
MPPSPSPPSPPSHPPPPSSSSATAPSARPSVTWTQQDPPRGHWIGPTRRRVVAAHFAVRVPFVLSFIAIEALVVAIWLDPGRLFGFSPGAILFWTFTAQWFLALAMRALSAPIARWLAWRGRRDMPATTVRSVLFLAAHQAPLRVKAWMLAMPVVGALFAAVAIGRGLIVLPLFFTLWALVDTARDTHHLKVGKLRFAGPVSLPRVDSFDLADAHAARLDEPHDSPHGKLWDPFGGYPRALTALRMSDAGTSALESVGLLEGSAPPSDGDVEDEAEEDALAEAEALSEDELVAKMDPKHGPYRAAVLRPEPAPPLALVDSAAKGATWIGPSRRALGVANLVARLPFIVAFVAAHVLAVMGWRAWWRSHWTLMGWTFLGLWTLLVVARAAAPSLASWLAWRGHSTRAKQTVRAPVHLVLSRTRGDRLPWWQVAMIAAFSGTLPLAFGETFLALPLVLAGWMLLDAGLPLSGLTIARITPARPIELASVTPETLAGARSPMQEDAVETRTASYWDPFGGYPRAVTALAMSRSGRDALVGAGLLQRERRARVAAPPPVAEPPPETETEEPDEAEEREQAEEAEETDVVVEPRARASRR